MLTISKIDEPKECIILRLGRTKRPHSKESNFVRLLQVPLSGACI